MQLLFNTEILAKAKNNFRYTDDNTLMAETEEELKSLLMKVKEESEKAVLKLNIQKAKIMASSHHFLANRWEKVQTVTNFIFLGSKITAMVFPSVMCGCASWTIKKAEC